MSNIFDSQTPSPLSRINWADINDDGLRFKINQGKITQVDTSNQPGAPKSNKPKRNFGPKNPKNANLPQGKKASTQPTDQPQGKKVDASKNSQGFKRSPVKSGKKMKVFEQRTVDEVYTQGYTGNVPSSIVTNNGTKVEITSVAGCVKIVAKRNGTPIPFIDVTYVGVMVLYNKSDTSPHEFVSIIEPSGSGYCLVVNTVKSTVFINKVTRFTATPSTPTPSPQANSPPTVHSERKSVEKVNFRFVSHANGSLDDGDLTVINGYVVGKFNNTIINVKPLSNGFGIYLGDDRFATIGEGVRINNNYFASRKNISGVAAAIAESQGNSGCNAVPLLRLMSNLFYGLGIVPGSTIVLSLPWSQCPRQ